MPDIYVRFSENSRGTAEQTIEAVRRLGGNPIRLSSDDPNSIQNINLNGTSVIQFVEPTTFDSDAEVESLKQLSSIEGLTFIPVPSGQVLSENNLVNFDMASRLPLEQTISPDFTIASIAKKAIHQQTYKNDSRPIFISYARESIDFALQLKAFLEGEQFEVWLDKSRIKVGQEWKREIDQALERACILIVVMCQNSGISNYVTYEWSYALGRHIPVYPIRLLSDDGAEYHPKLIDIEYADWTDRVNDDSVVWSELVFRLDELLDEIL